MTPACEICGSVFGVARLIAEWLEPIYPNRRWEVIARCNDSAACRTRLEAAGKGWPVRDPGARVATITTAEVGELVSQQPTRLDRSPSLFVDVEVDEWR